LPSAVCRRLHGIKGVVDLTSEQWTAAGVAVSLGIAAIGWALNVVVRRRADEVHLAVSSPSFHTADQHFNPAYAYSLGVRVINTGPGAAFDIAIGTVDPDQDGVYAEWETLPAMNPGATHTSFLGIHGDRAADDPGPEAARAYYERLVVMVTCWDRRGRQYLFTPRGSGVCRRRNIWKSKDAMYDAINSGEPARGEPPRSRGIGRRRSHPVTARHQGAAASIGAQEFGNVPWSRPGTQGSATTSLTT
jgi:hypothetical protein